jgi:hypothetical protein
MATRRRLRESPVTDQQTKTNNSKVLFGQNGLDQKQAKTSSAFCAAVNPSGGQEGNRSQVIEHTASAISRSV